MPPVTPRRSEVEAFIRGVYAERYGAEHAPLRAGAGRPARSSRRHRVAAAGYRSAGAEPLFLERYLARAGGGALPTALAASRARAHRRGRPPRRGACRRGPAPDPAAGAASCAPGLRMGGGHADPRSCATCSCAWASRRWPWAWPIRPCWATGGGALGQLLRAPPGGAGRQLPPALRRLARRAPAAAGAGSMIRRPAAAGRRPAPGARPELDAAGGGAGRAAARPPARACWPRCWTTVRAWVVARPGRRCRPAWCTCRCRCSSRRSRCSHALRPRAWTPAADARAAGRCCGRRPRARNWTLAGEAWRCCACRRPGARCPRAPPRSPSPRAPPARPRACACGAEAMRGWPRAWCRRWSRWTSAATCARCPWRCCWRTSPA